MSSYNYLWVIAGGDGPLLRIDEESEVTNEAAVEAERHRPGVVHHEAAHAVYVHRVGWPISYVRVGEHSECEYLLMGGDGVMHAIQYFPAEHIAYVVQLVTALLVGKYAENHVATGRSREHTPFEEFVAPYDEWRRTRIYPEGWENDDARAAVELLMKLGRVKARLAYGAACNRAANFVEREWRVIDAVARRLLEVGCLTGDELAQLIESVDHEEEQ